MDGVLLISLRAHLGCLKRFLVLLLTRHALAALLAVLAAFSVLSRQATSSQTAPQRQTSQELPPTNRWRTWRSSNSCATGPREAALRFLCSEILCICCKDSPTTKTNSSRRCNTRKPDRTPHSCRATRADAPARPNNSPGPCFRATHPRRR